MNNWLLFLLKSTFIISLLYLFFRLLIRKEPVFYVNRIVLLFIVLASFTIPFINLPHSFHFFELVELNPISTNHIIIENPVQPTEISAAIYPVVPVSNTVRTTVISVEMIALFVYLSGVAVSLLILIYSICSVLILFRKSRKTVFNGMHLMIVNDDIPAFSFRQHILISQHDYDTNSDTILTHELSHIKQGHFYDLMLMELVKIIYWFNPLVYLMNKDIKEIHEFQADESTLNSGIDAIKYQLLIIQKGVGHQKFALANSFNHCQIKNRIIMMNKSKHTKALSWKVATFLPVLAILLMAFGREAQKAPAKVNVPETSITTPAVVQKEYEQFSQKIEIKSDGNYIANKLCSIEEIALHAKKWRKANKDVIFLLVDELIPLNRIDEVREVLNGSHWVRQTTVNSDEIIYFAGDVNKAAKLKKGKWNDWFKSNLKNLTKGLPNLDYKLKYGFIIDENGKVRDAHIIKGCEYPKINAAYKNILTQIPDWEPAVRGGTKVSVYYSIIAGCRTVTNNVEK